MKSISNFFYRASVKSYSKRNIGIKIGKDIDIDVNDPKFFKVKPFPPRHLYPQRYHPKEKGLNTKSCLDNHISVSIINTTDCTSEISVKVKSVRPVNISIRMECFDFPEDN